MTIAEKLFYEQGYKIVEIANTLGKTRQTISNYLQKTPSYIEEKERRKEKTKERKKEQNKRWASENPEKKKEATLNWIRSNPEKHNSYRKRQTDNYGDTEMLRRDHEIAVKELEHSIRRARPIRSEMDYYISAYKTSREHYIRKDKTDCGAVIPYCLPKYV